MSSGNARAGSPAVFIVRVSTLVLKAMIKSNSGMKGFISLTTQVTQCTHLGGSGSRSWVGFALGNVGSHFAHWHWGILLAFIEVEAGVTPKHPAVGRDTSLQTLRLDGPSIYTHVSITVLWYCNRYPILPTAGTERYFELTVLSSWVQRYYSWASGGEYMV